MAAAATTAAALALAPGFRFHPSDEELVLYYLKRKTLDRLVPTEVIVDADIYKFEPWELSGQSKMDAGYNEWYFYCKLERKYSASERVSRSTGTGFWKLTGRPIPIKHNSKVVGLKRTLVFYSGRNARSQRTDWLMYEYESLADKEEPSAVYRKSPIHYVLCKVLHKINLGRPFDHHYGPFNEKQWDEPNEGETPHERNRILRQKRHGKAQIDIGSEGSGSCNNIVCVDEPPLPTETKKMIPPNNTGFNGLCSHMEEQKRSTDFIDDLQEELYKISLESEILKQEKPNLESLVYDLELRIQHLVRENEHMKAKLNITE